jgi:hypothetical protein
MAQIAKLDSEVVDDIREFQKYARQHLKIDASSSPAKIVERIENFVKDIKGRGEIPDQDLTIGLGVLLGGQYVDAFAWHWGEVVWDGNQENSQTCVLSRDNSLSINPIAWVHNVISTERSTNFLLGFNMIAAGNYPQFAPNEAKSIN